MLQKWLQVRCKFVSINKWKLCGVVFQKKIKRIDDGHVSDNIDGHGKNVSRFMEYKPSKEVSVRVLLPVDKMIGRFNLKRIGVNGRPGMGRRSKPNDLCPQSDKAVVFVNRLMMQRNFDGH